MRSAPAPETSPSGPCPQCGSMVTLRYKEETFSCPWCGSTLRPALGTRLYRLIERPRLSRREAAASFAAWSAGPSLAGVSTSAGGGAEVSDLRFFPFLRIKRPADDDFLPLAPLPTPDVLLLARVPADLQPTGRPEGPDAAGASEDVGRKPVDPEMLRSRLADIEREDGARELLIEERAYYSVTYDCEGRRYSAVIDAGSGSVLAARQPGRRSVMGERFLAPPVAALLFAEALLVPSAAGKAAAIVLSAALLLPLLRLLVERHG